VSESVERAGIVISGMCWCNQRGKALLEMPIRELWGEDAVCVGIERRALQSILLRGVKGLPTRLGISVQSLVDGGERVSVRFAGRSLICSGQMVWLSIAPVRARGLTGIHFYLGDCCFFGLCPIAEGQKYGLIRSRYAPLIAPA
jgi:hypothetical protein